jgi:aryl-alcohol dehydrogenase-like predicted oxidoreductase
MRKTKSKQQTSDLPKLAAPAQRALAGAGISTLAQASKFSLAELKKLHGIGPNAIEQLRQALAAQGLVFADEQVASAVKGNHAETNELKPPVLMASAL